MITTVNVSAGMPTDYYARERGETITDYYSRNLNSSRDFWHGQLAEKMADDFIRDMQSKGGIDAAIEKMTEAVKEGKDLLPDVSPALKVATGRAR